MTNREDFWDFVIQGYSLDEALADGVLVELFDNRCFSSQPPRRLVMTSAIAHSFDHPGLQKIWDDYLQWTLTAHLLPEEDRMFSRDYGGRTVWVIDDGAAISVIFKEDY